MTPFVFVNTKNGKILHNETHTFSAYVWPVCRLEHFTTFPLMPSPSTVLDISKSSVMAVVLGNLTVGGCCMFVVSESFSFCYFTINGKTYMHINFILFLYNQHCNRLAIASQILQ